MEYDWICKGWIKSNCPVDKPCEMRSVDDPGKCLVYREYGENWDIKPDRE